MAKLSWSLSLKVGGSSPMSMSVSRDPVEVGAVDRIEVKVDGESATVEIQPMEENKAIHALVVKLSKYDSNIDVLSFKVDDGDVFLGLEGPQLFSAGSMVLFKSAPRTLTVNNKTGKSVIVEVFVVRDACKS